MVQKAVEMGANQLRPVITDYTQVRKLNLARLQANIIEAAEQCGILNLLAIHESIALADLPKTLHENAMLFHCDEEASDAILILKLVYLPSHWHCLSARRVAFLIRNAA